MNGSYSFVVEKVKHTVEAFNEKRAEIERASKTYLDFVKQIKKEMVSVDILYQIHGIYQDDNGEVYLDWMVTMSESENVFGFTQIVAKMKNEHLGLYEAVPPTDFIYKMKNIETNEVEYEGEANGLNSFLENKYNTDIYSIPQDWGQGYQIETYYRDIYNGTEVKLEDGENQVF